MNGLAGLVQFPKLSAFALTVLGLGLLAALIGLLGYNLYRRRGRARARFESEWKSVQAILDDRQLSGVETRLLESLLKKHALDAPLRAVTTREGFDECVDREMQLLDSGKFADLYEEMGTKFRDIRIALGLDHAPVGSRIHSTRELHGGQWMYVMQRGKSPETWHRMMVQNVDEGFLYISADTKGPNPAFAAGETVACRLWRDEDGRYLFDTTIHPVDEPYAQWRLPHARKISRTQARADFRIRHNQTTWVEIVNAPLDGNAEDLKKRRATAKIRGKITSLSAGGCAVVLPQSVSRQVILRVELELPGEKPMKVEAKIVASSLISGERYLIRAHFLGLTDAEHDRIAKHVLRRQQSKIATDQEVD